MTFEEAGTFYKDFCQFCVADVGIMELDIVERFIDHQVKLLEGIY